MAITVGSVEVDVIPNTSGIYARLRAGLVPAATRAGEEAGEAAGRSFGPAMQRQIGAIGLSIGEQIGRQIASRITAEIRGALRAGITQGGREAQTSAARQGQETGGAFARSMKARLEAAFRSLPKIDIDADTSEVDSDLQALRVRMETLANKRIGIEIDAAAARAEVAELEEQLRLLGAAHPNVTVRVDAARARAELAAVREEIDRVSANPGHIHLETDGMLGQRLRAEVEAAEAALPNINIGVDTTPAEAEIASLRGQITALRDQRIGIDIDAGTALARITEIQARLERLAASDADVAVRVDAAAAVARLASIQALVSALDGQTARIDVDTSGALSAILHLTVAIGGLAIIPAIPILGAGIGAIGAAATASAVGIGALAAVAVPAVIGIAGALQAQKAAQEAASAATSRGAQAGAQAASRALQMAGAQQALASAHRNAARQISQAEQAVSDAVRSAAEANTRAAEQVKSAKQAVTDAVQQAADRQESAAEAVARAEDSLADAQRQARQAQQDLTQARKDAAAELEELGDRLANAQLSERDAILSVQEARVRLAAVQSSGSKATLVEQQRAQLAFDQAVQRLKEQTEETKSLAAEKVAADKAGVEGSRTVLAAQERIAESERKVAEEQKSLRKARSEAADQQIQSQRAIAEAQEKVAEASRNVSRTQEDGARSVQRAQQSLVAAQQSAADSIASAQRQIASASASAAGGVDQAALAQEKYQAALAKLSPAARGTYDAFQSLKTAFSAWSTSLQPAVMPIFTRALEGIKNSLPGLTPFVLGAAEAIGTLQDKISNGFKSPWWQSFRDDLAKSVVPATVGLGVAFGNVFKTLGGIVDAFLPHMDSISERMQTITGRWAAWATNLKGTDKFKDFLAYASEQGPILAKFLGDIGAAFMEISRAVSPLTGPVLGTMGAILTAIASIAETLPWLIQLLYAVWVATKLWALAVIALNLAMSANPLTLILIAIVAVVAAVIYAYKNWSWFRETVDAAWQGIQAGAKYAWSILQPILSGIWEALKFVGQIAVWLWENAIRPAFEGIWLAARVLFAIVVTAVITPIYLVLKGLGVIARWLWEEAFRPAFKGIADAAMWLWNSYLKPVFGWIADTAVSLWRDKISPAWELLKLGTRLVGEKFREIWNSYIKPAVTAIGEKCLELYDKYIKPSMDRTKTIVGQVKDAFTLAKDGIRTAWDQLVEITRKPVKFIVDTVYNGGIVQVWNAVAKIAGLGKLDPVRFATGGSVFGAGTATSDSIPALLSTGEHVWTAREVQGAGGHSAVEGLRSRALQSGSTFARGGAVGIPRFAEGGIVDWFSDKAQKIGSAVLSGLDFLSSPGKAWDLATEGLRAKIGQQLTGNQWAQALSQMPLKMLHGLKERLVKATDELIGGGSASGSVAAAVGFAKSQAGLPYQWGGAGNPSWDCSGFMSGIQKVILGQNPRGRLWSTFSFSGDTAPPGWKRNLRSPFQIGITNDGVGHTAGTLAGLNVESRGGDGVVVGSRARGYNSSLFYDHYGFAPAIGTFDSGGYLQPGMNLAYNGTGRPEPVLTTRQLDRLAGAAKGGSAGAPDQRSYQVVLQGARMTTAEQTADVMRRMELLG
ncbi:hypothetical protein ACIPY6_28775 [Streptomyces sp. NPDC090054]|uniref:hypothetical protein n=1 Tax=Streptomyces sp. NPDC090054 TaxID=3365933 RepID=UPI003813EB28